MFDVKVCLATLLAASALWASDEPLAWQAADAEQRGDLVRAWALYSQAAAINPLDRTAAAKALTLRSVALDKAQIRITSGEGEEALDPDLVRPLSAEDLRDVERLLPPPELKPSPGSKAFRIRAAARDAWTQVLRACGLDVVFDSDYAIQTEVRLTLDEADCRQAITATELLSGSFVVPLSEKLALVARDAQDKRREQERSVAVLIPLPEPLSAQDAQELARAVQQIFEVQKFAVDTTRRVVLIRDRASKVRPAQALFTQLLTHRAQVAIDVEIIETSRGSTLNFGLNLPTSFSITPRAATIPLGGAGIAYGIAIAGAQLVASLSRTEAASLRRAEVVALDQLPSTLHIGDRFPIIVSGFFGDLSQAPPGQQAFSPPPQIQFEDLGLNLKITPRIHAGGEVSMAIESDFKVLTGQTQNGIPIISNRKLNTAARLKIGESAIVAGLVSTNSSKSYSGIAGLSQLPLAGAALRSNTRSRTANQTLVVITPRLLHAGATEAAPAAFWVGTETKPLPPIE